MEIIQIIFILGIISFVMILKVNKSFKTTNDTINPNTHNIPPYKDQNIQDYKEDENFSKTIIKINNNIPKSNSYKKSIQKKDNTTTSSNKEETYKENRRNNISLRDINEAKKAFIYSEIFKRKY